MHDPRLLPVVVTVEPREAATYMRDVLDDYFAELDGEATPPVITIAPLDDTKRGTVLYRVIQASRSVAERFPEATMYLVTEDSNRWRLPPPAI